MSRVLMDRSAPADEVLSTSERNRVVRRFGATGSVIWKEALEPGAVKRARHESAMLQRLASVPGVAKLSLVSAAPGGITLEDDRGESLAAWLHSGERLAFAALLDLAIGLTETLAAVHRAGVVHRDVNPSNILLVGAERRPVLIDFDIASSSAEERPAFATRAEIEGTLAYIAPEQTGRTGRVMDQRADLYALGATFYEIVTGRTPFGSDDSFDVVRDHLIRVAVAPSVLDPTVPLGFSAIVMRLLEKEPDRRYQSAEGLAADLRTLRDRRARGEHRAFALATSDFPQRLLPPSRLIGRECEIATLRTAFDDALAGNGGAIFVGGAPGVGKTALIAELRSIATTSGGYFVSAKFDRYRRDVSSDAVVRALGSLYRLLLAEPETELTALRARLAEALGAYASSTAGIVPELGVLLGVTETHVEEDPATAEARLAQIGFAQLRSIATKERPVVFVLDDLQWAPSTALRLVDVILSSPSVPGFLFVGAYRESDVDASHALCALLARAKRGALAPRSLSLGALAEGDVSELLGEMLRLAPAPARALAHALGARTGGNPYDTVELVNGLRRDGVLTPGEDGWRWDDATIDRYVGAGDVVSRLTTRIDALPERSGALLDVLACLGSDVCASLLQAACAISAAELDERAAPALEDGLVVFDRGTASFRFRHDRIQQAAYARMDARRETLHITIARRLATVTPASVEIAAEQYLAAVDALQDVAECRTAVDLFRIAATNARVLANHTAADRFLSAARGLVARTGPHDPTVVETLDVEAHATLYHLGRLEEADVIYASLARGDAVDATCVQISSLTNRNRPAEAVALGLDALGRLGFAAPARIDLDAHVDARMHEIEAWCHGDDAVAGRAATPEEERRVAAAAMLIVRMMPPAFFSDGTVMAWLVLESVRLWSASGPRATLVVPIAHAAQATILRRNDYRTGYAVGRRILEIADRRHFEAEAAAARFLGSLSAHCWFERFETTAKLAREAIDGLVRGGDLQNASFAYYGSVTMLFQSSATLEPLATETEESLAFALRIGNHQCARSFAAYRRLERRLRGTSADGDRDAGERGGLRIELDNDPLGTFHHHVAYAQAAVLLDETDAFLEHVDAAVALSRFGSGTSVMLLFYPLHALACAHRVRTRPASERAEHLPHLDASLDWLRERARDASDLIPARTLVEAERAWALGDFPTASATFEAALRESAPQTSPGQSAFLTERAGRFYLAHGLGRYGRTLIADARRLYESWGATAKTRALDVEFALPRASAFVERRAGTGTVVSSDAIDMIAILRASQALSSQTSVDQLTARVGELLAALTGATAVTLAIRRDDANDWVASPHGDGVAISLDDERAASVLPLSAFRYVRRTLEPLVLEDATRDDRFARDPYFAGRHGCSLLVVPISSQGALRAVVLLENSLGRGAFATTGLDAVLLIAGQLAVSLDNALLYASLERKVAERTDALAKANQQLERLSLTDALTGLANRRAFDERLAMAWRNGLRADTQLGLIMIDIDEFKKYNDRYGHVSGDDCLERVARTLASGVRPESDFVARYGGEEFVIVVRAGPQAVAATAERLRAHVAALGIEHASSLAGIVTISLGVATFVPDASSAAATFLEAADGALYAAKHDGRNRVAYAPRAS